MILRFRDEFVFETFLPLMCRSRSPARRSLSPGLKSGRGMYSDDHIESMENRYVRNTEKPEKYYVSGIEASEFLRYVIYRLSIFLIRRGESVIPDFQTWVTGDKAYLPSYVYSFPIVLKLRDLFASEWEQESTKERVKVLDSLSQTTPVNLELASASLR